MRTKEELRAEFCKHDDKFEYSILSATISNYSQWLEQKLIDQSQEPKQREVSEAVDVDWDKLREKFFLDCVDTTYVNKYTPSLRKVNYAPHDLFKWFKDNLFKSKTK
jgi:hypothetical protein